MPPDLPFDIIALIIDIVGENKDTKLLKELALVSHYFLEICSKHLFATVKLRGAVPVYNIPSSKKGFVKLLKSRPDVVKYIRKLTYKVSRNDDEDVNLLPPILFLPTFSRLNCLSITSHSLRKWNKLDSSLTSAFLHLMHLPTINHIDLLLIRDFPLSCLTQSVNLLRLDLCRCSSFTKGGSSEIVLEMMPKIREFNTSESSVLTTKLLHAKRPDGRPAFNFMDLRRVSISFTDFEDEQNIWYLLQNAKLLERLHLSVGVRKKIVGLLSPSARTLKVLDLSVPLWDGFESVSLGGICEELEAIAGQNMLEVLSLDVIHILDPFYSADFIGSIFQNVENVLVKPGWSMLRQVSFKLSFSCWNRPEWGEAIQSLPDKYLSHLSILETVDFNYSASRHNY